LPIQEPHEPEAGEETDRRHPILSALKVKEREIVHKAKAALKTIERRIDAVAPYPTND
jgi:hypothetical protein